MSGGRSAFAQAGICLVGTLGGILYAGLLFAVSGHILPNCGSILRRFILLNTARSCIKMLLGCAEPYVGRSAAMGGPLKVINFSSYLF